MSMLTWACRQADWKSWRWKFCLDENLREALKKIGVVLAYMVVEVGAGLIKTPAVERIVGGTYTCALTSELKKWKVNRDRIQMEGLKSIFI
jgi:hypothetical protein